jgi:hypothetical protein
VWLCQQHRHLAVEKAMDLVVVAQEMGWVVVAQEMGLVVVAQEMGLVVVAQEMGLVEVAQEMGLEVVLVEVVLVQGLVTVTGTPVQRLPQLKPGPVPELHHCWLHLPGQRPLHIVFNNKRAACAAALDLIT